MSGTLVIDAVPEVDTPPGGSASATAGERAVTRSVIGLFDTHAEAEQAVKTLDAAAFPLDRLSIVGEGYHTEERPLGFYTTRDRVRNWGGAGLFWGSLWGLLFGAAFLWIPGVGPVAAEVPLVHLLATSIEGALIVGGFSGLGAALVGLWLPKKQAIKYQRLVKADHFLVIAQGTAQEVGRARGLVNGGQAVATPVTGS